MSEIAKIVGQRLRHRRLELGYSQEVASEKAGLHPTYIGQLERGEKNATLESIEKVCIALEYPMEELFTKIVVFEKRDTVATKCYNLITTQSPNEQKALFNILQQIIDYKSDNKIF